MRTKLFISVFALGLAFTAAVPIVAEQFFYPADDSVIISPDTDDENGIGHDKNNPADSGQSEGSEETGLTEKGVPSAETQSSVGPPELKDRNEPISDKPAVSSEERTDAVGADGDNSVISVYIAQTGETVSMTLGEYVFGAVLAEMPSSFNEEALKAQAVASRTYCLYRAENPHGHQRAVICTDHTHCAAFMSDSQLAESVGEEQAAKISAVIKKAVTSTADEIVTYGGAPALTAFHACSAGYTEESSAVWSESLPYLISVSSPETPTSKDISFSADELIQKLSLPDKSKNTFSSSPSTALRLGRDASGRVESAWICGKVFTGTELRTLLELPSAAFSVKESGGSFTFTVLGSGHGVGMSQRGADAMAEAGKNYRQILAHYYQGTELRKLDKIV